MALLCFQLGNWWAGVHFALAARTVEGDVAAAGGWLGAGKP